MAGSNDTDLASACYNSPKNNVATQIRFIGYDIRVRLGLTRRVDIKGFTMMHVQPSH